MALLDMKNVSLALGGPLLLDGVDLRLEKGERICLLGRNGVGKSTLLRLLRGSLRPDAGHVMRAPGLRVALLSQELPDGVTGRITEIVAGSLAEAGLPRPGEHVLEQVVTRARLDGEADYVTLSTGNKRRTLLARAMAVEPDILLLDEPTNHLDIDSIAWLEGELRRFPGTLFFVSHDRAFLRSLARRIIELDRGKLRDWTCGYDTFLQRREEQLRVEELRNAEFDRKLAEEEVWLRRGVLARRTRNEGRVRSLMRMREESGARRQQLGDVKLSLQDSRLSGKQVIRARGLNFAWDGAAIVRDFTCRIARGDKIGVLGPNGSGKTTLLRLLLGELSPDGGEVEHGTKLEIAYFDQQRAQLDECRSLQENIVGGADTLVFNDRSIHIISYLKNFLFSAEQARAPITRLSGGERNRLLLARLFSKPANLLVLDEPSNDLDLETMELLESLLVDFEGTVLLVSHDREFLDNVCTSTLVLEGDGHIAETVGGYSDWARTRRGTAPGAKKVASARRRADANNTGIGRAGDNSAAAATDCKPGGNARTKPRKLGFNERRELKELPPRIEAAESEQAELQALLSNPAFYQEAGDEVGTASTRLEELEAELTLLYARWEELDGRDS